MQYISLGNDCSVSYQLRKLHLQNESLPFDWMRIDNMDSICNILESRFDGFANFAEYNIKKQSDNFDNFDITACKSRYKMVHRQYGFTLPHEYNDSSISIPDFEEKYSRRIARFNSIVLDASIHKIFVRMNNLKDITNKLENVLDYYGVTNYKVIHIVADEYEELIPKYEPFRWQRDYIPWEQILIKKDLIHK
jgi:hypothetical protein